MENLNISPIIVFAHNTYHADKESRSGIHFIFTKGEKILFCDKKIQPSHETNFENFQKFEKLKEHGKKVLSNISEVPEDGSMYGSLVYEDCVLSINGLEENNFLAIIFIAEKLFEVSKKEILEKIPNHLKKALIPKEELS